MPTIHRERGYNFNFFGGEVANEPPHIHIWGKGGEMKIWLDANLTIARCYNIPAHEQTKLLKIVKEKKKIFLKEWYAIKKQTR